MQEPANTPVRDRATIPVRNLGRTPGSYPKHASTKSPEQTPESRPHLALWWLPVGAGGHFVIHTSRLWERLQALCEHRAPRPLFHAALEVFTGQGRYVVEMTPAWGSRGINRTVVATGPVFSRALGLSRFFRYEVRCWRDGIIPDKAFAPALPTLLPIPSTLAAALVESVGTIPTHVWGRPIGAGGDIWTSNSVVSWLIQNSGIDASSLTPPNHGSAPGWVAGIDAAKGAAPDLRPVP